MNATLRNALAGLGALAGAAALLTLPHLGPLWIPLVTLVVSAALALAPQLGAQLAARSVWWSTLLLGVVLCAGPHVDAHCAALALTTGCALALLTADRSSMREAATRAGLVAQHGVSTLQLLMVLTLADAQTFAVFLADANPGDLASPYTRFFLAGVLGFTAAFVGLSRRKGWGVAASMTTAAGLLAWALATHRDAQESAVVALFALLALQLVAPVPMLVAAALRRPLPALPARLRTRLSTAAVVAMWLLGALAAHSTSASR